MFYFDKQIFVNRGKDPVNISSCPLSHGWCFKVIIPLHYPSNQVKTQFYLLQSILDSFPLWYLLDICKISNYNTINLNLEWETHKGFIINIMTVSLWLLKKKKVWAHILQRGRGLSGSFLFMFASSSAELRRHQRRSVCAYGIVSFFMYVCGGVWFSVCARMCVYVFLIISIQNVYDERW